MSIEPLNILYLCADRGISISGTKGASAHIREFGAALTKAGHSATVVTRGIEKGIGKDLPFRSKTIPMDLSLNGLDAKGDLGGVSEFDDFAQNPYIQRFLADLEEEGKFDVIYERYSLFSIAGLKYAEATGLPFILEVNAPLVVEAARYRRLEMQALAQAVERYLFSAADKVIAVSGQLKEYISRVAPDARITVVPNGVDIERFEIQDIGRAARGDESFDFTVGFVGNIRPWHGVDILIRAFAQLPPGDGNSRLLIVGDAGKMKQELEKLCHEFSLNGRIEFTGSVPQDRIPGLMQEIDVAVAPYPEMPDFYFSSLKIFEYMAAGRPIVASRIGQIAEILEDGKTALLIPPGDANALAQALNSLRQNRALGRELGKSARLEAEQKHTWARRIEVITGIMRDLKATSVY